MDCKQWKEELRKWLEEEWSIEGSTPVVSSHLREHTEQCSECAAILEGALLFIEGKKLQKQAPAGLSDRLEEHFEEYLNKKWIFKKAVYKKAGLQRWSVPKWLAIPAASAVMAILVIILIFTFLRPNEHGTVIVHLFLEAPGASEVSVVGDWNVWDPRANRLTDADGDGIWEIQIKLRQGEEYQYQFIINGTRWVPDPRSPLQIEDGFGGINSILQI